MLLTIVILTGVSLFGAAVGLPFALCVKVRR